MTIQEILSLPTNDLAALSDKQLEDLLGPLIPEARRAEKVSVSTRDMNNLLASAAALLTQVKPFGNES